MKFYNSICDCNGNTKHSSLTSQLVSNKVSWRLQKFIILSQRLSHEINLIKSKKVTWLAITWRDVTDKHFLLHESYSRLTKLKQQTNRKKQKLEHNKGSLSTKTRDFILTRNINICEPQFIHQVSQGFFWNHFLYTTGFRCVYDPWKNFFWKKIFKINSWLSWKPSFTRRRKQKPLILFFLRLSFFTLVSYSSEDYNAFPP